MADTGGPAACNEVPRWWRETSHRERGCANHCRACRRQLAAGVDRAGDEPATLCLGAPVSRAGTACVGSASANCRARQTRGNDHPGPAAFRLNPGTGVAEVHDAASHAIVAAIDITGLGRDLPV